MTTDQWIAVWAAVANSVAGIGAAIAAAIMSRQTWMQRKTERQRYAWLEGMMQRLRNGENVITDAELPMALHWIHEGVLDAHPPTADPSRFRVRYRTAGQ